MTTYQLGETIRITAAITDTDGNVADPTTTLIYIEKPDGTLVVDGISMINSAVGTYYYDYLIPGEAAGISGIYPYKIKATGSAGRVTIVSSSFKAEASI